MSRDGSETPTPTTEHWPSRRPSFSRPPIRSPESPRLTEEEADELTSPYLPYETCYTYAYSRAYNKSLPDHWEVPNMVSRSESPYMLVHQSSPSILRQIWSYIQVFFITIWNYLYWAVKTAALDGPSSLLIYLYDFLVYVSLLVRDSFYYVKDAIQYYMTILFIGRRYKVGKDSYSTKLKTAFFYTSNMVWTIVRFIGNTLMIPVSFLMSVVSNSGEYVGGPAMNFTKSAVSGASSAFATILNIVLWPFDYVGRLVLDKWAQLRRKHVRINERSRRVRRFSASDSPSVVRDSEDDAEEPEIYSVRKIGMSANAARGQPGRTPRRHIKEIYDLRTRHVYGETTDEDETGSPDANKGSSFSFKPLSTTNARQNQTPQRRLVHQRLQRAAATTPRRGRPPKNLYADTDEDEFEALHHHEPLESNYASNSSFSFHDFLLLIWSMLVSVPYALRDILMLPLPYIHRASSRIVDFIRYLYSTSMSWISNNSDSEPIAARVREPRIRRSAFPPAAMASTARTSRRRHTRDDEDDEGYDTAAHDYYQPSFVGARPLSLLTKAVSVPTTAFASFGQTILSNLYNLLYYIAVTLLSCGFAIIDVGRWIKDGFVNASHRAYRSLFGASGKKQPLRLEVASDLLETSKEAFLSVLGLLWRGVAYVPMALLGRDTDGNRREKSWLWLLIPLLLLLLLFLVARHDPEEQKKKNETHLLDLASQRAYDAWGYMDRDGKYAHVLNSYYKSHVQSYNKPWRSWQFSDTPIYKIGHTTYNLAVATGKLALAPFYLVYDKTMDGLAGAGVRKIQWPKYEDLPEMPKMNAITKPITSTLNYLPSFSFIRDKTMSSFNTAYSTSYELVYNLISYLWHFVRVVFDVIIQAIWAALSFIRDILLGIWTIIRSFLFAIVDFFKELYHRPAPINYIHPQENVLRKEDEINTRTVYVPQEVDTEKIIAEVTRRVLFELKSHPLKIDDTKLVSEVSSKVLAALQPPAIDETKLVKDITAKVLVSIDSRSNPGIDEDKLVALVSEKVLAAVQTQLDNHKPIDRNSLSSEIVNLVLASMPKQTPPSVVDEKRLAADIMSQVHANMPKIKEVDEAALAKSVIATVMASLKPPPAVDEKKLTEKVTAQVLAGIKQPPSIDQTKLIADVTEKVISSLDSRISTYEAQFKQSLEERIARTITSNVNVEMSDEKLEAMIKTLIAQAIDVYDADKTGLFDYALESAGASVISTRCSENYNSYSRLEKFWNIPLYYSTYGPRVVIQRGSQTLNPGECWCFKHGKGYLTIDLSHAINISHISYEHIRKEMSPEGYLNSAPKIFKLWAYKEENDLQTRFLLGEFEYSLGGRPLQFFTIAKQPPYPVKIIEMEVISNYGAEFTCLYRLRVHGKKYSLK